MLLSYVLLKKSIKYIRKLLNTISTVSFPFFILLNFFLSTWILSLINNLWKSDLAKDLYLAVNLHIKLIFSDNFIWGVLQILCGMKLVSYKMPSQILHWSEDHLNDDIALACLLTTLPTGVHAYQLVNIFYLFLQILLISFAGMWITDSWAYLWAVDRY